MFGEKSAIHIDFRSVNLHGISIHWTPIPLDMRRRLGLGGDLLSVKKVLAGAENRQPQKWPPESVIDLTYESDNGDDNTVVSPSSLITILP